MRGCGAGCSIPVPFSFVRYVLPMALPWGILRLGSRAFFVPLRGCYCGGKQDQGHHRGDRRRYHEAPDGLEGREYGDTEHAVTA